MSLGLVGRKVGMTRVFAEDGASIPVTVLDMTANRVTQIKTLEADGYSAVQVTFGTKKSSRVNKAEAGHFAKAGVEAGLALVEFRVPAEKAAELKAGDALSVELFSVGQMVDVTGTSQGKGWAGVIKRYHFASNRATHGNSLSHRSAGSIGQAQDPGRVLPGKRMAGQLGNVQRTVQNLEIVRVDAERQLLLVKGGVPGSKGNDVIVRSSVKAGA
jgi:large subunit ribosomal protein L3